MVSGTPDTQFPSGLRNIFLFVPNLETNFIQVAREEQIWLKVIKGKLVKAGRWRKKAGDWEPREDSVPALNKKWGMIDSCRGRLSKSTSWVLFSSACIWNIYIPYHRKTGQLFFLLSAASWNWKRSPKTRTCESPSTFWHCGSTPLFNLLLCFGWGTLPLIDLLPVYPTAIKKSSESCQRLFLPCS